MPGSRRSSRAFGRSMQPSWPKGTEVLSGNLDDLLRGIQGVLDRSQPATRRRRRGPSLPAVLEVRYRQRRRQPRQASRYPVPRRRAPRVPGVRGPGCQSRRPRTNSIAQSCATIIYYGRGGDGWVKRKRQTLLLRVLGEHRNRRDSTSGRSTLSEPANTPKQAQYLGMKVREFERGQGLPAADDPGHCRAVRCRPRQAAPRAPCGGRATDMS